MGIKQIEQSPGKEKRSYASGHVFKCFKCQKWVRWLDDNELCYFCEKDNGIPRIVTVMNTESAVNRSKEVIE